MGRLSLHRSHQKPHHKRCGCLAGSPHKSAGWFLGRARLRVESALWSHVHVVVVEDPPPAGYPPPKVAHNNTGSLMESCLSCCRGGPPPWLADPPHDGWLGRSASTLTKRTCFQNMLIFPEMLVTPKRWKMPNCTSTWGNQTAVIIWEKVWKLPNHKGYMTKR